MVHVQAEIASMHERRSECCFKVRMDFMGWTFEVSVSRSKGHSLTVAVLKESPTNLWVVTQLGMSPYRQTSAGGGACEAGVSTRPATAPVRVKAS